MKQRYFQINKKISKLNANIPAQQEMLKEILQTDEKQNQMEKQIFKQKAKVVKYG